MLDQLATTPLVFPGIVLGVGVMQLFLTVPVGVYGTIWIIVWAFLINYLPYGVRYSYAGMLQVHRELEEAAAVAGASPMVPSASSGARIMARSSTFSSSRTLPGQSYVLSSSSVVVATPRTGSMPRHGVATRASSR